MNDKYELILGLEIHMQLTTDMKMFCTCANKPFGSKPNTHVCPVCMGLPGAMPVPNKEGLDRARLMAAALGTTLRNRILFERKNYFYPDLPKAFQITTPHYPIGEGGKYKMLFQTSNDKGQMSNVIRWREIHLEEDTAKSMHKGDAAHIDFNKSGVPLLEMVTEPDFHSIDQAVTFSKQMQMYARYTGVSEADMEKGHMRLEANISVREKESKGLPDYRVELKNINSFTFMKKALEAEFIRQVDALEDGEELVQETRGYDETTKKTFVQRSKEEAHDYRYFPEPDIPPIEYTDEENKIVLESLPTLPIEIIKMLEGDGVRSSYQQVIVSSKTIAEYTLIAIELAKKEGIKADVVAGEVVNKKIDPEKQSPEDLIEGLKSTQSNVVSDDSQLEAWVNQAMEDNPKAVEDIKNGKMAAIGAIMGGVMKLSRGKAEAKKVQEIVRKMIV